MEDSFFSKYKCYWWAEEIFDNTEIPVRSLESQGVGRKTFANLLSPIIYERIPKDLVFEFNEKFAYDGWNFNNLFDFLETKIQFRLRI